jgi:uncharacterized protein YbaR (Trm112 family)
MSALVGLKVKLDRPVDREQPCCNNVCIIDAGEEPHAGALYCADCGQHRGWLSKPTAASLERAWSEINEDSGRAASSTVEALVFSLRAGGTALACPHARRRLAELSEAQLHEVSARLQKFQPNIARAWTPIEVEFLVDIWIDLHG